MTVPSRALGGRLIIGKNNASAIGTLVERTTGYTILVHLPDGYKAEQVRDALAAKIQRSPRSCERHSPGTKGRRCATGKKKVSR